MSFLLLDTCFLLIVACGNASAIVVACADTYAPEPPYTVCTGCAYRAPACCSYRTRRRAALPRGPTHSRRRSVPAPGRTAHVPRTVAPQAIALCQAGAVVVGAAVAHVALTLTPNPNPDP
eukprot:scaffold57222_cov51-Phaeocystis_antarctica.AAC.5